jgi:phosphatidyl-myo-inositol alpha-mannosyltransferase
MTSATVDRTLDIDVAAPRLPEDRRTVLFVSQARGIGGSTRSLATVLSHLSDRVTRVLAIPPEGKFREMAQREELGEAYVALSMAGRRSWRSARIVAAASVALWAWRNRRSIAVIHANGPEELNLAAPAALVTGRPIVMWVHAFEVSPWTRRLAPVWRRLLRNHDVRWAAVSSTARRVLVEAGLTETENVTIVPNPIDPLEVKAPERGRSARVTIGFIGSAEHRKGFQMLPEVVRSLDDLPVQWSLYTNEFSRDAKDHEGTWSFLKSLPASQIAFPGKVEDMREMYASCDIVFIPSLKESFCRVAAESMMNAVPVVASDIEPLRDLLGDDDAGILFPPEDTEAASVALRALVLDPARRAKLGRAGRDRSARFEPQEVVEQLSRLYGIDPVQRPAV